MNLYIDSNQHIIYFSHKTGLLVALEHKMIKRWSLICGLVLLCLSTASCTTAWTDSSMYTSYYTELSTYKNDTHVSTTLELVSISSLQYLNGLITNPEEHPTLVSQIAAYMFSFYDAENNTIGTTGANENITQFSIETTYVIYDPSENTTTICTIQQQIHSNLTIECVGHSDDTIFYDLFSGCSTCMVSAYQIANFIVDLSSLSIGRIGFIYPHLIYNIGSDTSVFFDNTTTIYPIGDGLTTYVYSNATCEDIVITIDSNTTRSSKGVRNTDVELNCFPPYEFPTTAPTAAPTSAPAPSDSFPLAIVIGCIVSVAAVAIAIIVILIIRERRRYAKKKSHDQKHKKNKHHKKNKKSKTNPAVKEKSHTEGFTFSYDLHP